MGRFGVPRVAALIDSLRGKSLSKRVRHRADYVCPTVMRYSAPPKPERTAVLKVDKRTTLPKAIREHEPNHSGCFTD